MSIEETQNIVLDAKQIERKIERMAHLILEYHHDKKRISLVGIEGMGYAFAERLLEVLKRTFALRHLQSVSIQLYKLNMNKRAPQKETIQLSGKIEKEQEEDAVVILIDDVLHTGKTISYAMLPFLEARPFCLEVAVLVDRMDFRHFPIWAKYVGYSLSTTLNQNIEVDFTNNIVSLNS